MENTSQQLDQMQEMVNRLVAQNVTQPSAKPKPTAPARPVGAKPTPAPAKAPVPTAAPKKTGVPAASIPKSRPELENFYKKTWAAAASDKKFPLAERDLRINLANKLYADFKDTFYENEPCTKRVLKAIGSDHAIVFGARTDKVVAKIMELGLTQTLDLEGLGRTGDDDVW